MIVRLGEKYGLVEMQFLRMDGEAAYEQWTGCAAAGAKLYRNPWLVGTGTALPVNAAFVILEDLGGCYIVTGESGRGCMAKDCLLESMVYSNSSGSGSDGWTEPVL